MSVVGGEASVWCRTIIIVIELRNYFPLSSYNVLCASYDTVYQV